MKTAAIANQEPAGFPDTGSGAMNWLFLLMDNAPDFAQDRGHTDGSGLADSDKRALIKDMKMF